MTKAQRGRFCVSCRASLAADNSGRSCTPCERSGKTRILDEEVIRFALALLPSCNKLGVWGLDYAFYHGRLNEALQAELRELRKRIFNQIEPPRPLPLQEAADWAGRIGFEELKGWQRAAARRTGAGGGELLRSLVEREALANASPAGPSGGAHLLLAAAFDEPPRSDALIEEIASVSHRLEELEVRVPAAHGSLDLALVCGTPPLPPGLRVGQCLREWPGYGWLPTFVLEVFSAKEPDLKVQYREVTEAFDYATRDLPPVEVSWQHGNGRDYMEVLVLPYQGKVLSPAAVQREFRRGRSPVRRFYDGNVKPRDCLYSLRTWALHLLVEERRMTQREAIQFWNNLAPAKLRYTFDPDLGFTQSGESLLSQELTVLRQRLRPWLQEHLLAL